MSKAALTNPRRCTPTSLGVFFQMKLKEKKKKDKNFLEGLLLIEEKFEG